jgi:hypothetical protein
MPRTFGCMVVDLRQGRAIRATMGGLWLASVAAVTFFELQGRGLVPEAVGAALEGKEVPFGIPSSALFAAFTTGTSTGAVNSFHDSFTAAGGGITILDMMLGEVSPGGVGSGTACCAGRGGGVPRRAQCAAEDRGVAVGGRQDDFGGVDAVQDEGASSTTSSITTGPRT